MQLINTMSNYSFNYIIKKNNRAKHIRIAINNKAEVVITKPRLVPMFMVEKFVKENEKWITEKLELAKKRIATLNYQESSVWYLGREYNYLYKPGKSKIIFEGTTLTVYSYSELAAKRYLKDKLKKESKDMIYSFVKEYASKMNLSYNSIRLKDQSSRWGSCSAKKNLNFNWRLIMTPPQVLRYIVVHELAHLKYLDHSKNFWNYVECYDPEFRENRRWLRRHEAELSML
jgi:predicted metal-dependent hydrolase